MSSIKLYVVCANCGRSFTITTFGETEFSCRYCGQRYIYKYIKNGQYEIYKLNDKGGIIE